MKTTAILERINAQIRQLQQARDLLVGATTDAPAIATPKQSSSKRRGRPKGSVNKKSEALALVAKKPARRAVSPEGKARIATAQKACWGAHKKASVSAKPKTKKKTNPATARATEA